MPAGTVIGIGQIRRSPLASKLLVGSGRQSELPILDVLTKIDGRVWTESGGGGGGGGPQNPATPARSNHSSIFGR